MRGRKSPPVFSRRPSQCTCLSTLVHICPFRGAHRRQPALKWRQLGSKESKLEHSPLSPAPVLPLVGMGSATAIPSGPYRALTRYGAAFAFLISGVSSIKASRLGENHGRANGAKNIRPSGRYPVLPCVPPDQPAPAPLRKNPFGSDAQKGRIHRPFP